MTNEFKSIEEVRERLDELLTQELWAEHNAERVEDMDDLAHAASLRRKVAALRAEQEALMAQYGIKTPEEEAIERGDI